MRKDLMTLVAVLALTSCSSDSLVGESPVNNEAPIAFTVSQRNTTRASDKLEENGYNDFGVWAYKTKTGASALVMDNYQVGCAGYGSYSSSLTKGTWYYEGLGEDNKQVLRYWDLSYTNTNFYAYAPYNKAVIFDGTSKIMTVPASVNVANDQNDFVYANNTMINSEHKDVPLAFKHIGAKVNLQFYEAVDGYKVQLIDVTSTDKSGIQLTPATKSGETYTKSDYYTAYDAVIDFSKSPVTVDAKELSATSTKKSQDNLVFVAPTGDVPAAVTSGTQTYLASTTTYYAVAQPSTSETGFTLHVSFKLIAEDNSEEIVVRDARVYIPAKDNQNNRIALWESNKAYTYTFKITTDANGSTSDTEPDVTDPIVPAQSGLYPIVFDNITIEDYTAVSSESNI